MFRMPDGKNLAFTFMLVSSLFLLWGLCNGMIDTMDKHFQDQLNLSKAQSAWVQFAHYMGYTLMALPAGLLTRRFGYKGGIIFGAVLVSFGGFWFIPATHISKFWAFLLGVCTIAMGLTVWETVANPYTTVLGPKQYGAARINFAQSFNGVGWILGSIIGPAYFYSEGGVEKAHGQLYIPYMGVGFVVLVLAFAFYFAYVPDIKVEDEYHTDDQASGVPVVKEKNRALILLFMFLNMAAVGLSVYLILATILPGVMTPARFDALHRVLPYVIAGGVLLTLPGLRTAAKKLTDHSIWAHTHFSAATLAQFVYVAAQAGIFSFFINSMTVDKFNGTSIVPPLPPAWNRGPIAQLHMMESRVAFAAGDITDFGALAAKLKQKADPVAAFLYSQLDAQTVKLLEARDADPTALRKALLHDLNLILRQELNPKDQKPALYDAQRFAGVPLAEKTRQLLAEKPAADHPRMVLNRLLLQDAFPQLITYDETQMSWSDKGAGRLSTLAFCFFLLGRGTGAAMLRRLKANIALGTYGLINVIICGLIMAGLGWVSVTGVFLSYFFMSIMFPTIMALGIFGLGSQSKKKAAAFIVMSITGGALMPKVMGHLGDVYSMAISFLMPLVCFALIAIYGFSWTKLSQSESVRGLQPAGGH